jgi:uncharacterized membrane protein
MVKTQRSNTIDSLRGLAIALMIAYHFCYDLTYYNFVQFDFYNDTFWINSRTFIVSLFLSIAGISMTLAYAKKIPYKQYFKRISIILTCALAITLVSYFMFPGRTIFFGILHLIALSGLIGIVFVKYPFLSIFVGSIVIFIGNTVTLTMFNQDWLHWIGLMTYKPPTEDYVPLLPWFGVYLCGIGVGHFLIHSVPGKRILNWRLKFSGVNILEKAGQHSLLIYMIHQPILLGIVGSVHFVIQK